MAIQDDIEELNRILGRAKQSIYENTIIPPEHFRKEDYFKGMSKEQFEKMVDNLAASHPGAQDTATRVRDREEEMNRYFNEERARNRAHRPMMTKHQAREEYFATLRYRCGTCRLLVPAPRVCMRVQATMLYDQFFYYHVRQGTVLECGPLTQEVGP